MGSENQDVTKVVTPGGVLDQLLTMNGYLDTQNKSLESQSKGIESLRSTFETGLRMIALIPVSVVFASIFTGLFFYQMIEQWLWAMFMLILMYPYYGEGMIKILSSGLPWTKNIKSAPIILWALISAGIAGCAAFQPYVHIDKDGYEAGAKGSWTDVENGVKNIIQPHKDDLVSEK